MSAYTDELFKRVREGIGLQNPAMIAGNVRSDLAALEGYIAGMERGVELRNAQEQVSTINLPKIEFVKRKP